MLPGVLLLVLFYSLAIHMRSSLGTWRGATGASGFSRVLLLHAQVTIDYFILLFLTVLALPLAIVPCLMKQKWQGMVPYLALFALAFLTSWVLMQFAAGQFLEWWRD